MEGLAVGIDIGTSSIKALCLNRKGEADQWEFTGLSLKKFREGILKQICKLEPGSILYKKIMEYTEKLKGNNPKILSD